MRSVMGREKVLLKPALHVKDRNQYKYFIDLRNADIYVGHCPEATRMDLLPMLNRNFFRAKY